MVKYKLVGGKQNICTTPIIIEKTPKRIIAIGDIHGDLELLINCLTIAKLIQRSDSGVPIIYTDGQKRYYKWIGDKTVVVQVGDQVDRCRPFQSYKDFKYYSCIEPETTFDDEASDEKILRFMTYLHHEAAKHGGAVYSLLGNHELMNAMGNVDYVSYLGLEEYTPKGSSINKEGRKQYFKRGSEMSKFIACTRSAVMIIGKHLFVHAGFLSLLFQGYEKKPKEVLLNDLNNFTKLWLLNENHNSPEVNSLITGINSPFWFRGLGYIPPGLPQNHDRCQDFNAIADYFKIKGMVIGHTPQLDIGINATCGNKLFRIDVASSKAFTNTLKHQKNVSEKSVFKTNKIREPQVLEILDGKTYNILNEHCELPLKTNGIFNDEDN